MYENNINSIKRAQEGDKFEMDRLIRENNGLIWSIVKRFMNRGYEEKDLTQILKLSYQHIQYHTY